MGKRQLWRRNIQCSRRRRLQVEPLEDRRMLAAFTVTNLLDGPVAAAGQLPGSLRQAIFDSNASAGADEIDFSVNGTIAIGSQLPTISDSLTITGPGANLMTINAGNGMNGIFGDRDGWRIFRVDDADDNNQISVAISALTLTGGDLAFNADSIFSGGAIANNRENLTVTNCIISGNTASFSGGAILNINGTTSVIGSTISGNLAYFSSGGGIANSYDGTLNITNSTISNNSSQNGGGGIVNYANGTLNITNSTISNNSSLGNGGGISNFNYAALNIEGSTISGNSAVESGGGIYSQNNSTLTVFDSTISGNSVEGSNVFSNSGGGIYSKDSLLAITDSTISGNSATGSGGGIFNDDSDSTVNGSTISGNTAAEFGGGIGDEDSVTTVIDSTISGNSAGFEGGGIDILYSTATVTNTTISGNSATYSGGGIRFRYGIATVAYSTISGNSAGSSGGGIYSNFGTVTLDNTIVANSVTGGDISGSVSGSFNLIEDGSGGLGLLNTISGDPLLGQLQDNGGPTFTHALLVGSPAIDAGDPGFVPPPDYDQRGVGFDRVVNGRIDIGAFEVQADSPSADYDTDGDIDGRDFLAWQRGESPDAFSGDDLALWQGEYGGGGLSAVSSQLLAREENPERGATAGLSSSIVNAPLLTARQAGSGTLAFEDFYVEEVDRALEELSSSSALLGKTVVAPFGEMVARRGVRRAGAK
ncbi:MAG: choice-of-anchor Q domain-containing protein [Bythopirellula sp.]|nr:choice-of-anchor Q domain-containing protein [Bythopirellula sp.]